MNIKKYPVPQTKEPFVNAPLDRAGFDPVTGEERFWISTVNANVGNMGVLINASGKYRTYKLPRGTGHLGASCYSTCLLDNELMWLVSDTAEIRRLNLATGEVKDFKTGAKPGLVFVGMQYDEPTGKALFLANTNPGLQAVIYNLKTCETVKIIQDFTTSTLALGGFPNSDGTYTMRFDTVDHSLWRWDPKDDSLVYICDLPSDQDTNIHHRISGEHGWYIPNFGWFDGYHKTEEPKPETEAQWFGRNGNLAYGRSANIVQCWDMTTGKVTKFCDADSIVGGAVTKDGSVITINMFGLFQKFDANGALQTAQWLDAKSYGVIDCMVASDNGLIIGTPFITQRFWVYDENLNKGYDAGRAAPGSGEVLRVWNLNGKIYQAVYTSGTLTEFDPNEPAYFPENPHVVAKAPTGMRPVAHTSDERCLYYACNHHYGHIGCIMTKYDTVAGKATYLDNPLDQQHIISLYKNGNELWAGTTWMSDCRCCNETSRESYLLKLDPETMEVLEKHQAPEGISHVNVYGTINGGLLIGFHGESDAKGLKYYNDEAKTFSDIAPIPAHHIHHTGRIGEYILLREGKIEHWIIDPETAKCVETILEDKEIYNISLNKANGKLVLCAAKKTEFYVIRDFMD